MFPFSFIAGPLTPLPNSTVAVCMNVKIYKESGKRDTSRDDRNNDTKENYNEQGIDDEEVNQGTLEEKLNSNDHGKEDNWEERDVLIQYDYSGNKILEITLDGYPGGMATVTLGDRTCLALSYT